MTVIAIVVVIALRIWGGSESFGPIPTILALAVPGQVVVGESVAVFGSLEVPEGRYEVAFYNCQGGGCVRTTFAHLEGPAEAWRAIGLVQFSSAKEPATVELRVFDMTSASDRLIATMSKSISVVAVPPSP